MANNMINGIVIKDPDDFRIERFKITTLERLANADMTGDLVGKKIKLFYTYEFISGYDLDVILEAIWEINDLFFNVAYLHNGVQHFVDCYVGAIPSSLYRAGRTTNWVWKDVSFNLIQR